MLFNNIQELIALVGGAVNSSVHIEDIAPAIDKALHEHVAEVIGADTATDMDANPGAWDADTLTLLHTGCGYLGLYIYSLYSSAQMGGQGLVRIEGDNARTAYKYQEKSYREAMQSSGWEAIESLVKKLEADRSSLMISGQWTDTIQEACRGHLINYASEMRYLYRYSISRVVYNTLRPIIADVEEYILRDIIGDTLMDEVMKYITDPDVYTHIDPLMKGKIKGIIPLMQKALVHITITEAVQRDWVRVSPAGIVATETYESAGMELRRTANVYELNTISHIHERWAIRVIKPIQDYLTANELTEPVTEDTGTEEADSCRCGNGCSSCGNNDSNRVIAL